MLTRLRLAAWALLGFAFALVLTVAMGGQVLAAQGRSIRQPVRSVGHGPTPAHASLNRTATTAPGGRALVNATVNPWTAGVGLPGSFLGLSTEYWDVPALNSNPRAPQRLLGLLRVPGGGPVVLRIGGNSADQTYWRSARLAGGNPWPYVIDRRWLLRLRGLVRAAQLRVILDLNLGARSPRMAARFARAAVQVLGAPTIAAFEIGNEPDVRHQWVNYHRPGHRGGPGAGTWDHFSAAGYARAYQRYARALARAVPGVPVAGPALAAPQRGSRWLHTVLGRDRRYMNLITIHRYPVSACARLNRKGFATIARVLSPQLSTGIVPTVAGIVKTGRQAGLPVRLTELNSMACEGRAGVSNTFAAALWAPDALFSMWSAGIAGVNIHVREAALNAAFMVNRRGLRARPLLYGLIMFQHALGPQATLIPTNVGPAPVGLRVWAVRSQRQLNVMLLNKGRHTIRVALRVPGIGWATVQRLNAPRVGATGAVTLNGQTLGRQGTWLGQRTVQQVGRGPDGRYILTVRPYSAALVGFHI